MKPGSVLLALLVSAGLALAADEEPGAPAAGLPEGPDFKEVLGLAGASGPRISPGGGSVVYSVRKADWEDNRYDSELWLARLGEEPFQLTRTEGKSSSGARWSPDGRWIAFLADRGNGTQIWLIGPRGGEARALTAVKDGVSSLEWSPDGKWMAVAITDERDEMREKLEKQYGAFAVEDGEFRMTHLWLLDVAAALELEKGAELPEPTKEEEEETDEDADTGATEGEDDSGQPVPFRRLTESAEFTVDTYRWSPDGTRIAFDHRPDTRIESFSHQDVSLVDVADGEVIPLVRQTGYDGSPIWSPDGKWILFATGNGEEAYYLNNYLAKVPAGGGDPVLLTSGFDENPQPVAWLEDGIRFVAWNKTYRRLYRMSPDGGEIEPVERLPRYVGAVDFSEDGRTMAFEGEDPDTLDEIYRLAAGAPRPERLTRMSEQTAGWSMGRGEVIEWKSRDDATIEGVLVKPKDFDPARKHPLLVIVHGGPTGISRPRHVYSYVYPVQQWLARGAIVLEPNYRGSAGYGEAFRSLNVGNLGVGDAWDVLSGVDHLVELGFVDPDRIGVMGWSQGGYISAFLSTTSDRFAAISVGAGISDWMTYYVNTDIHPFTRHYLEGTPWSHPEVYAKTSPITYIKDATTPTLIQHGELDRRVPTPNAYELFQGLQDVGVETKLIIYKGFGHGITKPKERLAATWHNWQWFARHVWGEEAEIPVE